MLHVLVGAACNNHCLFCMESDRQRRAVRVRRQSPNDIRAMMQAYGKTDEILFTSGEPTLEPLLPTYVRWARQHGFRTIGVITNGRRLAYAGYLRELAAAGVNRITVSIHGPTAKLHDGLTRCPGAFAQTMSGLENVARLRRTRTLALHTSTVLTRRVLPHLTSLCRLLLRKRVDVMVLNLMMAKGHGATHAPQLLPSYPDVVRAVSGLAAELSPAELLHLRVEDLPPCFATALPECVRGDVEDFEHFEESGSTGLVELPVDNPASTREAIPGQRAAPPAPALAEAPLAAVRSRVSTRSLRAEADYYLASRSFKESLVRVKGEPCTDCRARDRCLGVWEPYVSCHGWTGFRPVQGE